MPPVASNRRAWSYAALRPRRNNWAASLTVKKSGASDLLVVRGLMTAINPSVRADVCARDFSTDLGRPVGVNDR